VGGGDGYPYQQSGANTAHVNYGGVGLYARVEDLGGAGTAGGHWKEAIYDNELMTGYVEGNGVHNIMSRVTLGALVDLGYAIHTDVPDLYTLPPQRRRRRLRTKTVEQRRYYKDTIKNFTLVML
jgi:hypothetical protein